jgi:phenylacetate-coenzyme A ligase PaaK-like adenylate-forming protein
MEGGTSSRLLVLDGRDISPHLRTLLNDFKPDMYYVFPSTLGIVSQYIDQDLATQARSIFLVGELAYSSVEKFLRERFPNALLRPQYMIQELGSVSSPVHCNFLPISRYHPAAGVELGVHEPDETGAGELLVSARVNDSITLDRYRYGDIARIFPEPCPCGAVLSFEIIGRSGLDFLRFGGATLRREEFDRVFQLCRDLIDEYRVELSTSSVGGTMKGVIALFVHREDGTWDASKEQELVRRFSEGTFLTPTRTLGDLVTMGIFLPLEVRYSVAPLENIRAYKNVRLTLAASQ